VKTTRTRKGKGKYMNGISGAGGAPAPPVTGVDNPQTVAPASAPHGSGDYNSEGGETSVSAVGEVEDSKASEFFAQHTSGRRTGMSTEFFLNLHNSAIESATAAPQSAEFDFKKLMEMLIALQLLEQLSKDS